MADTSAIASMEDREYRYRLPVSSDKESTFGDPYFPAWWTQSLQRIGLLLDLEENWDSYGARPIDRRVAYNAVQILQEIAPAGLPVPAIVPTANGRLQFEWHAGGIDLEFEVLSAVRILASYEDAEQGVEWEKEFDYDLKDLGEVLRILTHRVHGAVQAA